MAGVRLGLSHSLAAALTEQYAQAEPTPAPRPYLVAFNATLATELGWDAAVATDAAMLFSGNQRPEDAYPIALAYAGHQFGNFVPLLGDGRAILLGERITTAQQRVDIQLKGAGRTPFSRGGDGRAAIGPVLREYLISEAMHALGIPTTRALAAVLTGETLHRPQGRVPGAVLTRVAQSHLRIGSLQLWAAQGDTVRLRALADYAIDRHDPAARAEANPYLAWLNRVIERSAHLVAGWQAVGFVHGVMNTDNTSLAGETLDYGPCAFLDAYDPRAVFSSIDRGGRYAFGNQPALMHWNLARLAEALLPLLDPEPSRATNLAYAALDTFVPHYEQAWRARFAAKLGLSTRQDGDEPLIREFLSRLEQGGIDFTQGFCALHAIASDRPHPFRESWARSAQMQAWLNRWQARIAQEPDPVARLAASNPRIIPRNGWVEHAVHAATERLDFAPFHALLAAVTAPFQDHPAHARYAWPPPDQGSAPFVTFCGT
ncbi:protein adenylyltransferase SelO [Halothiobacillus sp. DCM-1]|uniref:protein adenylyltransferase SelO n=1 Tax=Halothiobacillus sp. DCM-1 TaxID=3112558 RepID=UPI0032459E73